MSVYKLMIKTRFYLQCLSTSLCTYSKIQQPTVHKYPNGNVIKSVCLTVFRRSTTVPKVVIARLDKIWRLICSEWVNKFQVLQTRWISNSVICFTRDEMIELQYDFSSTGSMLLPLIVLSWFISLRFRLLLLNVFSNVAAADPLNIWLDTDLFFLKPPH